MRRLGKTRRNGVWVVARAVGLSLVIVVATFAGDVSAASAQTGPATLLIDADFPDPTLVRDGDYWYAFATNGMGGNVQVRRSTDLRTWQQMPDALPRLPAWADAGHTWAPTVARTGPRWTMFFTARHLSTGVQCIGRATASAIGGPFVDDAPQPFVCQMDRRGSIDPSIFAAGNGELYLLYKSEGIEGLEPTRIWSQRLNADASATAGSPVQLAITDQTWEQPIIEGPTMVELDGTHWLLYAGNHWESPRYSIGVARCDGPVGPCMKSGAGPLLASTTELSGPGAPDVTTAPDGSTLLTFHAWDATVVGYRDRGQRKVRALPLRVAGEQLLLGTATAPAPDGYRLVASDGGIFAFGAAGFEGSTGGMTLNAPIVDMTPSRSGDGYWLAASDGGMFAFGDTQFFGSMGGRRLNRPIVGMAATPSGGGYWLVASDGGIFAFGDAPFFGSMGGTPLNKPIVSMAATASGRGYWLVASDGGIFSFGDARFHGSTGAMTLNAPIVDFVRRPWATGYWLVASDGGIFSFGDARFHGSTGAMRLNDPIVAATATPTGAGYWFTGADGGVYSFGDAVFHGSTGAIDLNAPIVGISR